MPVPRLAVEPPGPQRLHPLREPTQPRPPDHDLSRWSSATSRSTSGTTSRAASRSSTHRTYSPTFDDGSSAADYYPQQRLFEQGLELHPQYVLENGVDFAHFKFVHKTPIVPGVHPPRLRRTGVLRRLHHHLRGRRRTDASRTSSSGVEAINGGLGIAVTKSWGMIDNRTISAITPVDESTSDVRFMVYIGRTPGKDHGAGRAQKAAGVRRGGHPPVRARTSTSGRHQRYSDPPALASV